MTATAPGGRRIEIGARILPPLPEGSRVHVGVWAGDYQFTFHPSLGLRLSRWLPVALLVFWLFGWAEGERFALSHAVDSNTPSGVRVFLFLWTIGWTVGGLGAAVIAAALAFRPSAENILLKPAELVWRPAYPLMKHFGRTRWAFFRSLLTLHRRSVLFPRERVEDISIIVEHDSEDQTTKDHLVLRCDGEEYKLGVELGPHDLDWLCAALNAWMQARG